jgi:hypothetical protein
MTPSEGAPTTEPNIMMAAEDDVSLSEHKLLVAALKREVLLLRNEMNFEMFLKQQHLQHIGRLHREHVMDTSVEAERQQLVRQALNVCDFYDYDTDARFR